MTLIAYMPLASGALSGRYSAAHRPAGWRRYMCDFRGKGLARLERITEVVADLATQHGKTPTQVALRWLLQQPNVLPIPGARNGQQATQNIGALSFALTASEMSALRLATAPESDAPHERLRQPTNQRVVLRALHRSRTRSARGTEASWPDTSVRGRGL